MEANCSENPKFIRVRYAAVIIIIGRGDLQLQQQQQLPEDFIRIPNRQARVNTVIMLTYGNKSRRREMKQRQP